METLNKSIPDYSADVTEKRSFQVTHKINGLTPSHGSASLLLKNR
jgi:hypothetical protein